jgi:hypothetical protein
MLERLCLSIDRLHACQLFASRCEGRKKVSGSRGPFVQARAHEARWWFEAGGSGSRGRWTGWRVQLVGHVPRQKLVDKMEPGVAGVLIRLHYYPLEVILTCVRWYVAYPLSLLHLEEMMAERGIAVDHSTEHRWANKLLLVLGKAFRRCSDFVSPKPLYPRNSTVHLLLRHQRPNSEPNCACATPPRRG